MMKLVNKLKKSKWSMFQLLEALSQNGSPCCLPTEKNSLIYFFAASFERDRNLSEGYSVDDFADTSYGAFFPSTGFDLSYELEVKYLRDEHEHDATLQLICKDFRDSVKTLSTVLDITARTMEETSICLQGPI
jgi:hypothetical protein